MGTSVHSSFGAVVVTLFKVSFRPSVANLHLFGLMDDAHEEHLRQQRHPA